VRRRQLHADHPVLEEVELEDRFDLTTHARIRFWYFSIEHVFVVFFFLYFFKNKKNWGKRCRIFIFLLIAFQILHLFLPDISIHCALIEYAYI
jgi:hypothetical protein